jgi:NADPH:quinone reductase-like Zn-dependent oxidoreductase
MHAAVVTSFDAPPRYCEHPDPVAVADDQSVVDVVAAALHPRVRSQANGSHYTSTGELPLVPGIDAVVRDDEGRLRYALLDHTASGSMAERTVVDTARSIVLPDDVDPVAVAAAMNPVMSSWVALRRRVEMAPGARVLVLGATGNAGKMALQVARRFGASQVIAAARSVEKLAELGDLAEATGTFEEMALAADVDVVLDYVWGAPTVTAMLAMLPARADRSAPLTWVEIGSVGGHDAAVPSAALRSTRLDLVGSGIGSVSGRDFAAELPEIARAVSEGAFDVRSRAVPLRDVEQAWVQDRDSSERIVFVP